MRMDDIVKDRDIKIKENYDVFCNNLDSLIETHGFGKFVLILDRKIIDVFDTQKDAFKAGRMIANEGVFSVQEITKSLINLGIYSCKEVSYVNN
jgi:CRISPR/Cas system CMR-associated protein Cmr5 small subunit